MGYFNIHWEGEFSFSHSSIYIRDNRRIVSHRKQNQPKQKQLNHVRKSEKEKLN